MCHLTVEFHLKPTSVQYVTFDTFLICLGNSHSLDSDHISSHYPIPFWNEGRASVAKIYVYSVHYSKVCSWLLSEDKEQKTALVILRATIFMQSSKYPSDSHTPAYGLAYILSGRCFDGLESSIRFNPFYWFFALQRFFCVCWYVLVVHKVITASFFIMFPHWIQWSLGLVVFY